MSRSRLFLPLLLIFSLLFAQQSGFIHTLRHMLSGHEQQNHQQTPHNHYCDQCALDIQLGSALHNASLTFTLPLPSADVWSHDSIFFHQLHSLSATARGPPALLQLFA